MMNCKLVSTVIALVLILNICVVSADLKQNSGTTIYVDDDGTADYTKIQDAIDNASSGDTIYVYNGTYCENIVIDVENISLIGEDKNTTIIDGGLVTDTIQIIADSAVVYKFTITKGNNGGFSIKSNYSIIKDNIITNNGKYGSWGRGITICENSHNNTISDNLISNEGEGIYVFSSNLNKILNNTFTNNEYSIYLLFSSNNNSVIGNKIQDGGPLLLSGQGYNTLSDNILISDYIIVWSPYNTITNNYISKNSFEGLFFHSDEAKNNIVSGNIISENKYGISFMEASNNIITKNIIKENKVGIRTHNDGVPDPDSISLFNNTIIYNDFLSNKIDAVVNDNLISAFLLNFAEDIKDNINSNSDLTINNKNYGKNNIQNFGKYKGFHLCDFNKFKHNYWDGPRFLPKPIFGITFYPPVWTPLVFHMYLTYDLNPASKPNCDFGGED